MYMFHPESRYYDIPGVLDISEREEEDLTPYEVEVIDFKDITIYTGRSHSNIQGSPYTVMGAVCAHPNGNLFKCKLSQLKKNKETH